MGPPLVLAGSASGPFAQRLAAALDAPLGAVETRRFPDGEAYVRVLDGIAERDVVLVQTTHPDTSLVELLLLQDAVHEAGAAHVTTVVPYFAYARQDRVFHAGEPLSARALARALSPGTDAFVTVDPHKEAILAHFDVPARSASAIDPLADRLRDWGVDVVLAPDKGARDRAERAARRIGAAFDHLEKTRLNATEVRMCAKDLDVRGRSVAIVDDLIASGGTMLEAARQLKAQGARTVHAACTHGLFTGGAVPRLLAGGIDRVLCTDTLPTTGCDVVSAAPAVAALLKHVTA